MRIKRSALVVGVIGLAVSASAAPAATIKSGNPLISSYRGKPVAVVFFHPL